ncbi:hypothetical protein HGM15179_007027 [Zosterops borbonicus]|uniref:Uncharacterized protein n=1 Tax=Zosterops borbonicus TaxID=364589 RepID=A0A8K1GJF1_9PASS|nr:hypothetical protein HGM15179_007027 [Zosterops borbonicus]
MMEETDEVQDSQREAGADRAGDKLDGKEWSQAQARVIDLCSQDKCSAQPASGGVDMVHFLRAGLGKNLVQAKLGVAPL